jgi:hypothetical protein
MPELLRDIASRLREFVGNRRRAPRHKTRLPVAVSLLDARPRAYPAALEGHTRDLSTCGLALILPAIRLGERYLTGDAHTLRITLRLPAGSIQIHATAARYERLDDQDPDTGYLVGVRIKEMSDKDRALFEDYLRTLK